jgi:hypothetical protein
VLTDGARRPCSALGRAVTITDGPFSEAKEVVGGFAILQANSKNEAIEMVKRFLKVAGDGECEIRQVYDAPDQSASATEITETLAGQFNPGR